MKVDMGFERISEAIRELDVPKVDLVVGIGRGGVVPASLLAYRLGCGLIVMPINYRDDENQPQHEVPRIDGRPAIPAGVRSILLVDDVAVSGSTLQAARRIFADYHVTTLVLKGQADIVVFPHISSCVNWPWNSELSLTSRRFDILESTRG